MNPLGTKVLISVGAAGALGGAGYGIHALTKDNDSVENYLKKQNLTVVSQQSKAEWDKAYETYQLEKNLVNLEITVSSGDDIKKWCSDNLNKTINSTKDPLYKRASKWCVKYKTIEEVLTTKKFEQAVEKLQTKHDKLSPEMQAIIKEVKLSQSVTANENGEKIKQWCTENSKRSHNNENKSYIDNIKSACLTEG